MAHEEIKNFDTFIKTSLNSAQQKAVLHDTGTLLVVAGAGSGKTRVITARITHLILSKQVNPASIVALTFTNKAANEMKERIAKFLGDEITMPFIGTFHSYCLRILKRNNPEPFSILDEDDQKKIITRILSSTNLQKQITPRAAVYQISHVKNQLSDTKKNPHALFNHPLMGEVYDAYEKEKKASKCFDFDDLLLETLKLFHTNTSFKERYQNQIQHILVDEYQDTNVVQNELLKQMAKSDKKLMVDSVCAVGDEDQSIYSWRGATIDNMLNFKKDFPGAITIKIEQNYRSVQPILDVANHVIDQNINRNPKNLWSDKKGHDRIRILTCASEYQESSMITQFLTIAAQKQRRDSIAILYRTHVQSRAIEEALIKALIPYKVIGGVQFYNRKEVKDLLAYLRLIVNPFDRPSFFRIINTPGRGLGQKFEEQCFEYWNNEPFLTCMQLLQKLIDDEVVTKTKKDAVEKFMAIFAGTSAQDKPSSTINTLVKKMGYIQYLQDQYEPDEAQTRTENIAELIDGIKHFESQNIDTIELFLDEVALMQDKMNSNDEQQDKVLMMTLHAAKGLEFDTIILAGLEEGILPSMRSLDDDNAIEEERRLFYVGITRAKERLLIMHAKYRHTYGKLVDQFVSRFLNDMPPKLVTSQDCSYWTAGQQRFFFSDWLGIKNDYEPSPVMTFKASMRETKSLHTRTHKKASTYAAQSPLKSATTKNTTSSSAWRNNQPVMHAKYGMGMVKSSEIKGDDVHVTVQFKAGVKKIIGRFLQKI